VTCLHDLLVSSRSLNPVHLVCARNGLVARGLGETSLNFETSLIPGAIEAGALFSFSGSPTQLTIRVGISFLSETQACANAESEIGTATFEEIVTQSKALWNERLSRIEIDIPHTPPNITELLYSSLYRASLTPVGVPDFEESSSVESIDVFSLRIMLQTKRRENLLARLPFTSTRSIAGMSRPPMNSRIEH
jgi:hypothetical protein